MQSNVVIEVKGGCVIDVITDDKSIFAGVRFIVEDHDAGEIGDVSCSLHGKHVAAAVRDAG